jgi:hypothetical protein
MQREEEKWQKEKQQQNGNGSLMEGEGNVALGSGLFKVAFSFGSRIGDEPGTNPEELSWSIARRVLCDGVERGARKAGNAGKKCKGPGQCLSG